MNLTLNQGIGVGPSAVAWRTSSHLLKKDDT